MTQKKPLDKPSRIIYFNVHEYIFSAKEEPLPTRDDVARLARVSTATVSRAYNNPDLVARAKVERIMAAAKKLRYQPDKNASALRRSGSGAVALLESTRPSLSADRYYSWLYAKVIRALKSVFDASPYRLVLLSAESPADIRRFVDQGACDAFICHGLQGTPLLRAVQRSGLPYLSCWRDYDPKANSVQLDEIEGGRMAAARFRKAGLARPAHITGALSQLPVCRDRLKGFADGFRGADLEILDGELGIAGGHRSARKLIPKIQTGRIDCVFVVNDLTAIGALQAFLEAGLRIPGQVSIIGYGNLPFIDTLPVRLTTVDEQMAAIYARAGALALELIREPRPVREYLKPVFIEGDSVKGAPA